MPDLDPVPVPRATYEAMLETLRDAREAMLAFDSFLLHRGHDGPTATSPLTRRLARAVDLGERVPIFKGTAEEAIEALHTEPEPRTGAEWAFNHMVTRELP